MAKKLTYEFVKYKFDEEGYTLLSNKYINSRTKLNYRCPNGHFSSITWSNWKQGHRCLYCSGKTKLNLYDVKNSFEKEGYELLSKTYINNSSKLKYICKNGHKGSISWNSWSRGHRCSICAGNSKFNFSYVKQSFANEGYTLLSTFYININFKLCYLCPNGHKHLVSFSNWLSGVRCPTCYLLGLFGEGNPNWKGGKSFEEYCPVWKDEEYKQSIRERDGNVCLNPYCDSKNPNDLTIHHIDYDKQNCHPSNLITVCRSCNIRANKDRRWHKAWYSAIMNMRYADRSITYGK